MPFSNTAQQAFDTWPQWHLPLDKPPTIIRRVTGGRTNQHYLLKAAGRRVVMRVNNRDTARLGIDRAREQRILEQIQGQPFAPVVFYCRADEGVLVTEYIAGRQWQAGELSQRCKEDSLVELVKQIHGCQADIPDFDYCAHAQNYWQRLLACEQPFPMSALRLYRGLESRLPAFQQAINEPVLCHHDLTPANIIETGEGQLKVLDWEYAGRGAGLVDALGAARFWQKAGLMDRITRPEGSTGMRQTAQDLVDFYELAWSLLRGESGLA